MKKECLGFKVEKWDKDSKPLFNAWSEKREVFPCVPVSEHEAYKEKVKKAIAKWEGHFSVVNFFDLESVEYKQGYFQALNDIKKELGLNTTEHDCKQLCVKKKEKV